MRIRVSVAPTIILLASGLVATPAGASAQQGLQEFGMKAGVNFSTLKIGSEEAPPGLEIDPGRRLGLVAGVYLARQVYRSLAFQGEALVSVKGTDLAASTLRLTYLEIPLLARVNVREPVESPIHVLSGPALAFKLDASAGSNGASVDVGSSFENFDLGWVLGGGIDLGDFVIDARYVWGLLNAPREVPVDSPKTRNETFAIMFGLKLGRR